MSRPTDAVQDLVHRLGRWSPLDGIAERASSTARMLARPTIIRNTLSGTWPGHQLHPLLCDAPIGAWAAATFLDLLGGPDSAVSARRLVGAGILAVVPVAAASASDWSHTRGADRRVGLVHAAGNEAATALQAASWLVRGTGRRGTGIALSVAALGLTGAAGYLGGHLSYAQGVGVNRTAFQTRPTAWTDVVGASELRDNTLSGVTAQRVEVVLIRQGEALHALSDTCTHDGAPPPRGRSARRPGRLPRQRLRVPPRGRRRAARTGDRAAAGLGGPGRRRPRAGARLGVISTLMELA